MRKHDIERIRHTPASYTEAFRLYLEDSMPMLEIADTTNVKMDTLRSWMRRFKWAEERRKYRDELVARMKDSHMDLVLEQRPEVIKRQLKMSKKLDKEVEDLLGQPRDGDNPSAEVLNLARAAKSSADIASRAVGVSHTGERTVNVGSVLIQTLQPKPADQTAFQQTDPIDVECEDVPEEPVQVPF